MSFKSPRLPRYADPVFGLKSGFSKTPFLRSPHYEKFFGNNILTDKICPGSGFALKGPVHNFNNPSNKWMNTYKKMPFFCIDFVLLIKLIKASYFLKRSIRLDFYHFNVRWIFD